MRRKLHAGGASEESMDVLHTHCAGLDVHKDTVVACARRTTNGRIERDVRTFSTMTSDLLALSEWLTSLAVTHVAMEATGVCAGFRLRAISCRGRACAQRTMKARASGVRRGCAKGHRG
jgi:hypothetical protein